jgi:hypothetical protein
LAWSLLRALALVGGLAVFGYLQGFGGASNDEVALRLIWVFVVAFAVQALILLGGYFWLKLTGTR